MDKKEFCECLLEDRDNIGALQTYIVTENAYKLAEQLRNDNKYDEYSIIELLRLFESAVPDEETHFYYNGWYTVEDFLIDFCPDNSGFEYTFKPFDFKFNGVSIFELEKFYSELEKELAKC